MRMKFELTIDAQPDSVGFELKWPERGAFSGVSFVSETSDPLDAVVTSIAAQIKTIIENRFLNRLLTGLSVKYADVPTSVDDFLERKWGDGGDTKTKQTVDWHAVTLADQERIRCDYRLGSCNKPATLCQHPTTGGGGFYYYCDEHAAARGYTGTVAT